MPFDMLLAKLGRSGKQDGRSRQQRLYDLLKRAILEATLPEHTMLPGTRQMAQRYGLARNSVLYAYELLRADGFVVTGKQGTRVAKLLTHSPPPDSAVLAEEDHLSLSQRSQKLGRPKDGSGHLPFIAGVPDVNLFPWERWTRHLDRAWKAVGARHLAHTTVGGELDLREAIATQLRVQRGLLCNARQVLITSGARMAIDLCARMLADQGDTAWMENPGYPSARAALHTAGLKLIDVPVDEGGMAASERLWQKKTPRLVFVTPTPQYPMGSMMPLERRMQLLQNARAHRAWIIEDDYDSDLLHAGSPLPAIQSLSAQAPVVYVGTFSKSLFPALRLGYMVVPDWISEQMATAMYQLYSPGRALEQVALARFIDSGDLMRHLRTMRVIYQARQQCLRHHLDHSFGDDIIILGGQAGVHLTVVFRRTIDDRLMCEKAFALGVTARPLSDYHQAPKNTAGLTGLVLGYGVADENTIAHLVPRLKQAYDAVNL